MSIRSRLTKAAAIAVSTLACSSVSAQAPNGAVEFDAQSIWTIPQGLDRLYIIFDDPLFDPTDPAIRAAISQGGHVEPARIIADDSSTPQIEFEATFHLDVYRLFVIGDEATLDVTGDFASLDPTVVNASISYSDQIFAGDILTESGNAIPVNGVLSRVLVDFEFSNFTSEARYRWFIIPTYEWADPWSAELDAADLVSAITGLDVIVGDEVSSPAPAGSGEGGGGRNFQIVPPACAQILSNGNFQCSQQRLNCTTTARNAYASCKADRIVVCVQFGAGGAALGGLFGGGLPGAAIGGGLGCGIGYFAKWAACHDQLRAALNNCQSQHGICTAAVMNAYQTCLNNNGNPVSP